MIKIKKNFVIAKIDIPSPIGIIGLFISVQLNLIISMKLCFVSAKVVFVTPNLSLDRYLKSSFRDS